MGATTGDGAGVCAKFEVGVGFGAESRIGVGFSAKSEVGVGFGAEYEGGARFGVGTGRGVVRSADRKSVSFNIGRGEITTNIKLVVVVVSSVSSFSWVFGWSSIALLSGAVLAA